MTNDTKYPRIHLVKPDEHDVPTPAGNGASERYARKKDTIVSAATGILNRRGVKGMTLADVAASVDLSTTSVTYYFKKKEDLAVACFRRGIAWFDRLIAQAFTDSDPRARLRRFIDLYLASNRRIREGEEPPIAVFSDIRALKEPYLSTVLEPYNALFRKVRTLFQGPGSPLDRHAANARTHVLMEQIYWSVVWLARYDVEDYPRIGARMFDILNSGLAARNAAWEPVLLKSACMAPSDAQDSGRETFLIAATKMINQHGYRGASVEKISAHLNVTKGSFYHHNEAKDDLVVACFERTFDVIRRVQSAAMKVPADEWHRLCSAAATLADYQVSEQGPLLRASALSALPEPIRQDMVARWTRVSDRFAAMISDGVSEGSIRPVDPVIAAQLLNAALNAAASLGVAVPGAQPSEAATLYAKPFLMGIFSE
jgi:AcrR family transcriptional regulator